MGESGAGGHVMSALVAGNTLVQTGFSAVPSDIKLMESRVHACFLLFYSIGDMEWPEEVTLQRLF